MKTRGGKSRDPVKEQFWRRTIAAHARSGLSIQAFCQREGLESWNFLWWRRAIDRRDRRSGHARGHWPVRMHAINRGVMLQGLPFCLDDAASLSGQSGPRQH